MVSLILVCEALGNGLKGGLLNIVDFTFNSFWSQLVHRLEFDDHHLDQVEPSVNDMSYH